MRLKAKRIFFDRNIPIAHGAKHCGVSPEFLYMVLNGHRKPSPKVRRGLAKFLKLPQRELFVPLEAGKSTTE